MRDCGEGNRDSARYERDREGEGGGEGVIAKFGGRVHVATSRVKVRLASVRAYALFSASCKARSADFYELYWITVIAKFHEYFYITRARAPSRRIQNCASYRQRGNLVKFMAYL